MKKIICNRRYFFILLSIVLSSKIFAQQSIFDKDTVAFIEYKLNKDEYYKSVDAYHNSHGQPLTSQRDTLPAAIKVKRNNKEEVYWHQTGNYLSSAFRDIKYLNNIEWDDFEKIIPLKGGHLPLFKTFKKDNAIIYRSIGNQPLTLFTLLFSDTTRQITNFLLGPNNGRFTASNIKLTYKGEKDFDYRGMKIPCYHFESIIQDFKDGLRVFEITCNSILIEKASLLPVFASKRYLSRIYLDRDNAEHVDAPEGYYWKFADTEILEAY